MSAFADRHAHRRSQELAERAALMRAVPTESEVRLWGAIRAGRLGTRFRQQVVVGEHIVDFLAPAARLVVEVDGTCHEGREVADARRDRVLRRLGYRVLGLPAELVMRELGVAVSRIVEALAEG
ncbi:MAG: DUF559 domain-containing protein [Polyangiaceae bacterium]|nr:DUF559 domain-containing protein [Polyangiaceae bacterium]